MLEAKIFRIVQLAIELLAIVRAIRLATCLCSKRPKKEASLRSSKSATVHLSSSQHFRWLTLIATSVSINSPVTDGNCIVDLKTFLWNIIKIMDLHNKFLKNIQLRSYFNLDHKIQNRCDSDVHWKDPA